MGQRDRSRDPFRNWDSEPVPLTLELERYVNVRNPVVTTENGLFHNEIHTYPPIAIREALMNAFSHRDYQMPGAVMVKQYPTKLQITNPGNFLGDIRPDNILHQMMIIAHI